ncbi:Tyrosine-protein phosphatase [Colletotrichum trifolii]|uniref:Tyrosine-protein phosphatase n=1 Tax=Colletotrichum trifolii TaxID=5466 RepID=A0A4R8RWP1_COLTR|nr:Tyrosine-protein phosphatase [Colletotrichum trifolii]
MSSQPLPSPPFHPIEGIPNFRDIGGYPLPSSSSSSSKPLIVRPGLIYRSAEPSRLTPAGESALLPLGITHVYDLRSAIELNRLAASGSPAPIRTLPGSTRVFVPVFLDEDYGPEAIALRYRNYSADGTEGFTKAYASILRTASSPSHPHSPFTTILTHLASSPSPILIHCTAGKDRTGVICALILSLCGLDDAVVAHEYSLTDAGLQSRREEIVNHLLATDALRGDPEGARRMIGARKENMLSTLAHIRREYGSVEAYVRNECRISQEQVDQIRKNLIMDAAEGHHVVDWASHQKHLL